MSATHNPRSRAAAISIALAALSSSLVQAQQLAAAEVWEQLLDSQLQDEKKCVLAGTLFVREMPSPDGVILSGRAHCLDGRLFDFSQSKPHMEFEIRARHPVAC